jgi:Methyltransferase domain
MQNIDTHNSIYVNSCIVCKCNTHYFFSKYYATYPGSPFPETLKVDYWKCENCGFTISKTHQEMQSKQWQQLNTSWHHHFEDTNKEKTSNQPPYADHAVALVMLGKNNLINLNDALDYAAGYGTLSKFLSKYFNIAISLYDRYVHSNDENLKYISEIDLKKYKLVINSAMFEHVLNRESLDEVNNLVSNDGVLMLHTRISERIPNDPNWFYLAPIVHTAFHTNRSMEILMEQWGYAASVYSPQARLWFLFKNKNLQLKNLEKDISNINNEIQTKYFHYKTGFLDYWKTT